MEAAGGGPAVAYGDMRRENNSVTMNDLRGGRCEGAVVEKGWSLCRGGRCGGVVFVKG